MKTNFVQLMGLHWDSFEIAGITKDHYDAIKVSPDLQVLDGCLNFDDCYGFTFQDCGAYGMSCIADTLLVQLEYIYSHYVDQDPDFSIRWEGASEEHHIVSVYNDEEPMIHIAFNGSGCVMDFIMGLIGWNVAVCNQTRYQIDFTIDFDNSIPCDAYMRFSEPCDLLTALVLLLDTDFSFEFKFF